MIRVLIVDDSTTLRLSLKAILESDPGISVAGMAASGEEAVRLATVLRPNLITMDVFMPGIDGYETTRRIMELCPTPIVVVSSALETAELNTTFNALQAGALNVMPKPPSPAHPEFHRYRARICAMVRGLSQIPVGSRSKTHTASADMPAPGRRGAKLVAIGASTGGPAALNRLLGGLPAGFPAPVLVVQHMTPGFTAGLASWLQSKCALPVRIAEDGQEIRPGAVYLAPDDRHLTLRSPSQACLTDGPPLHSVRPSVSVLFDSVAAIAGGGAVGVLLTGMGKDGADGLCRVRAAGGIALVQDEASSVVWGMPGAAVALGAYDQILPVDQMARTLCKLVL